LFFPLVKGCSTPGALLPKGPDLKGPALCLWSCKIKRPLDSFVPALTTAFSGLFLIWGCTPMKLRDHPLLWRQLTNQWPPVWASLENEGGPVSGSEDGVLTEVREAISRSDGIVLIMHHNDNRYGSILIFSDLAFRRQIFQLLKDSVGVSIQQVGDIDLSCTL